MTHATLAVFGAVLTTVLGALYQLGTMFTQTELHGIDLPLRRFEEFAYPTGVTVLAAGRLIDHTLVATVGGLLVISALTAFAVILARKLHEMQVAWTPMHRRYAVVAPAILLWAVITTPVWIRDPLSPSALFGASGGVHLLSLGIIGFVLFGTLYHIVPFIVWVHQYSDRLGFETVPMIDDLYDDRIATVDLLLLVLGTPTVVAWEFNIAPQIIGIVGGGLILCGMALFVTNMALVIHHHSPHSLTKLLVGVSTRERPVEESNADTDDQQIVE